MSSVRLKILGAAQTVTGSKYLLTVNGRRILVDCGLFQGLKNLRLQNWEPLSVDPKTIDAIVLTHAHIDHSGYIPRIIKEGFKGKVYCTPATLALCRILLPDTGYLLEEEAEYMNRKKISKHHPALPLFSQQEAEEALKRFVPRNFHEEFEVGEGIKVQFLYAGHILGAAMALVSANGIRIGFSGDVGRLNEPIFRAPEKLPPLDYLVVESTYGDHQHPVDDPMLELEKIIHRAVAKKGVILIPAFAVGRTQALLYYLAQLKKTGRIPSIPMYLNSPMATDVTRVFCEFNSLHKLGEGECAEMYKAVHFVRSPEESKLLNQKPGPMLIVSASGMATGGRVLHHLKEFAPDPKNTIVMAGFQAAGTRGRAMQDGVEEIKIHGQYVPVRAEVRTLENLSAHADCEEIMAWLQQSQIRPRQVFVTHGEPAAAQIFSEKLSQRFGWNCLAPELEAEFDLGDYAQHSKCV